LVQQLQLTLPCALLPAEQFGGAFSLVTNDIKQNIEVSQSRLPKLLLDGDLSPSSRTDLLLLHLQRLRTRKEKDPQQFEVLFNIIDEEVSRNDHNHSKSCTKGLLWLKR
jgi:hypothetical protein